MSEGCASDFSERDRESPHDGDEAMHNTTGYPVAPIAANAGPYDVREAAGRYVVCTSEGVSAGVGTDWPASPRGRNEARKVAMAMARAYYRGAREAREGIVRALGIAPIAGE